MPESCSPKSVRRLLCPTDLSPKSQKTLGFAARLAERLDARLTAVHCASAAWFSVENRLSQQEADSIRKKMDDAVLDKISGEGNRLQWQATVIENSFDAATDIINLANETDVNLIVMKARPGMLSAFRFGSIVERVVSGVKCPVLLLPSRFISNDDIREPDFRRILFDYVFSLETDALFQTAMELTSGFEADLHLISVLQPRGRESIKMSGSEAGMRLVQVATREKLGRELKSRRISDNYVSATVEWGDHAETVLRYAENRNIGLICTTLAPPHFYYEKLYSVYLGQILKSARCPILVKQSVLIKQKSTDN